MASTVSSRFACLPDDVDDEYSNRKKRPPVKKTDVSKPSVTNKKTDGNIKKKKNKENNAAQPIKPKPKSGNSGNSKRKKEPSPEQWEEWKEKDEKMVDGNYEDELTQAMLLSKIDFEENKEFYEQSAKSAETDKKSGSRKNKKQIRILTVEEFHNLGKKSVDATPATVPVLEDAELLKKMKANAKKEIAKENNFTKKAPAVRLPFDDDALTLAQVKDSLEKKIIEFEEMKELNIKLKEELLNVKSRNKQIFQIFANGEMKDKAEILVEVEGLKKVQVELLAEVKSLHEQLEQERSKVRSLTNDHKSKDKHKKRTTSSGEQL